MEALLISVVATVVLVVGVGLAFVAGTAIGLGYGYFYFDKSESSGQRNWPSLRRAAVWNLLRYYFSYESVDLSAHLKARETPVIFACRPHGMFAISCGLAFAVNPQSRVRCAVHRLIFWVPLLRDLALWLGCIDATRENISAALERGESVALVPGGAREMIAGADPTRHRGFLRIAYERKVPVVCVYFQGESELFWTWNILRSLREAFADFMGYPFPSFFLGPLPRRLTTIASKQTIRPFDYPDLTMFMKAYDIAISNLEQK